MKKKLIILSAVSLLALAGCVKTKPGNTSSSSTGSESSTTSSSSSSTATPEELLEKALTGNHDNMTSYVGMISPQNEGYTWYTYYDQGYEVVYDLAIAQIDQDYAYRFFHDYEGESYIYLEGSVSQGERSGWLCYNELYGSKLGLAHQYSDEQAMLDILAQHADAFVYSDGWFFLTNKTILDEIVTAAYPNSAYVPGVTQSYWYDSTSVNALGIGITAEGVIRKAVLFNFDMDLDSNSIDIDFYDVGTTDMDAKVPTTVDVPEAPNANNTLAYWQYKGLSGPYINVYPEQLAISISEGGEIVEGVCSLEIEDVLTLDKDVEFDPVAPDVEDARIIQNDDSLEWVSSDEEVASFDISGHLTANKAGEVDVYLKGVNKDGDVIESNKIRVKVNPLAEQNLEGAVYNISFSYMGEEKDAQGLYAVTAKNALNNNLPMSVKANGGVKVVASSEDSAFAGAKVMNIAIGYQSTMNDPEFAGDGVAIFDFDDQQVSGVSFYYAGLYNNYKDDVDWLKSIKIQTSNDGNTWVDAADITEDIIAHISNNNLKLMEKSFSAASKVRIVLESKNMIGVNFSMGLSSIAFIADETCHGHVDTGNNPVTAISIKSQGEVTSLRVNKTLQFLPTLTPADATNNVLTWYVDDATVATIDEDGMLTAKSAGTVKVWATDNTGLVKSNEVTITVNALPAVSDNLNGTWKGEDLNGNNITLVVNGTSMLATVGAVNVTLTYEDYDDDNYYVYKNGTNVIRVKYSNDGMSAYLSVRGTFNGVEIKYGNGNPQEFNKYVPVTNLVLSTTLENNTIVGGNNFAITASFTPSDATTTDLTWTSNNNEVVTINESSTGAFVYTNAVESDTVVVISAVTENGVEASISITVAAPKKVASISVSLAADSIEIGRTTTATATVLPENADNKEVTWSSSDTSIATVDKNGVVTGKSAGQCEIIATAKDGSEVFGKATITVTEPAGETIDGTYTGWTAGNNDTFTITISNNGSQASLVLTDSGEEGTFTLDSSLSSGNVYVFVGEYNYESDVKLVLDLDNKTASLMYTDDSVCYVWYSCDEITDAEIAKD